MPKLLHNPRNILDTIEAVRALLARLTAILKILAEPVGVRKDLGIFLRPPSLGKRALVQSQPSHLANTFGYDVHGGREVGEEVGGIE
jgi:hypothetical protein